MTVDEPSAPDVAPPVRPRILVFFDYACQFCYLDRPRFLRLREEHDADLFLIPFELRPQLPPEGTTIDAVGGHHSDHVVEHMKRMAQEGGLELAFPSFVPNTHIALALGEYARDIDEHTHERVHAAVFAAYNADELDIGRLDVVLDVAKAQGLDAEDVSAALSQGRYDERLHQFYHFALELGVSATPAAVICNELFIGTRPYQVLEESVRRCMITKEQLERAGDPGAGEADEGVVS